jgi:iron complex outermembrane receptor protein
MLYLWPPFASAHAPAPASEPACAAGTSVAIRMTGSVVDVQGGAIAGARVSARCADRQQSTTTGNDGTFTLHLPAGTWEVRIEREGFEPFHQAVVASADRSPDLHAVLAVAGLTDAVTVRTAPPVPEIAASTKTDIPLMETPQAITVVTRQQIESQGAQNLQDALNYAAGVRSDAYGLDSRADSYSVRGGYPAEYLDGLRNQLGGFYTSTARTDPYQLERVEVVRGPASMLFGQGSTGGVVNAVSKLPLDAPQREVGFGFGSFNRLQLQGDLTGPVTSDGRWLYRFVFLGRHADTQVDEVRDNRLLVAPSLRWQPGENTSLTLQFRAQQDRTGSTLQFQPWSGTVLSNPNGQIPTSQFLGEPGIDHYDADRMTAGWSFQHRAGRWSFRQNARFAHNDVDYQAFYPDSYSEPGSSFIDADQRLLNRYFWGDRTKVDIATIDQQAETAFTTGTVEHQAAAGIEYIHFGQRTSSAFDMPVEFGGGVQPIDAFSPVYTGYVTPALEAEPRVTQQQLGVYAQDQARIARRLIVVGGVRQDWATSDAVGSPGENDAATTGRAGVMYDLGGWSPYVSYSQSFTPTAGTDIYGNRYKPLRGEQVEAGVKLASPNGRVYASAAAYTLDESNRLVGDPTNPLNSIQVGTTRTRGVELEVVARVLRDLDVTGHYNFLDLDPQLEGAPAHQVAIWGTYRFGAPALAGLQTGLGLRYMTRFTDATAPETPELTLLDGMVSYDRGFWRYAINVQNLTDKVYVSTCLARGDCFYGARRTIGASITRRF